MHFDEGSGKDWLSFEERNGFMGTCPPPGDGGRGQSLKCSRCESERDGESHCKLAGGFDPLNLSHCKLAVGFGRLKFRGCE